MEWLNKFPPRWKGRGLDQKEMINIEATHAARYWKNFYKGLAYEEEHRRSKNPLSCALDAVSVFISSIILRWVLFHKLSPYHGFIHRPATYAALVYDLMEPYRGYIEEVIYKELKDFHKDKENLTAIAIDIVKEFMDEKVYTNQTRQIVTFHELLHGIVLALRSYLLGYSKGFLIPIPSKPNGGRPMKAGYKLYGRSAGPTDFWQEAQKISTKPD
jgi:CRISPR/Cas system-associated endonuclease Cas1